MVLSVKLAEAGPWSNFLWEKLVKVVSCFLYFSSGPQLPPISCHSNIAIYLSL